VVWQAGYDGFAMRKRAGRLLAGDFTPPKTAHVTFDQLVLSDGTTVASAAS
jgi:hypothetical protein